MLRSLGPTPCVLIALTGCAAPPGSPQTTQVSVQDLVGTWEGFIRWRGGAVGHRIRINAIRGHEGQWLVDADRGKGNALPMSITVEDQNIYVDYELQFPPGAVPVRLRLVGGGVKLSGELRIPWLVGRDDRRAVRLEKVGAQ